MTQGIPAHLSVAIIVLAVATLAVHVAVQLVQVHRVVAAGDVSFAFKS